MLEASMAEDLQYPADNEQADGNKPHDRGAGMASDHGSDRKKRDYSNEKSEPNSCIKQDPGGYRREGSTIAALSGMPNRLSRHKLSGRTTARKMIGMPNI